MKCIASPAVRRVERASTVLLALALVAAGPVVGQVLGVSVVVVGHHEPQRAAEVPMPAPGHVMVENAEGRHYYFEGTLDDARAYYRDALGRRGYVLLGERADDARAAQMQWRREDEVLLIELRAAVGLAPTRISLRVMKDPRPHAPG